MGDRRAPAAHPHSAHAGRPRRRADDGLRAQILSAIEDYWRTHSCPPTIREIGAAVQVTSTGHVAYHVGILEEQGLVRREPGRSRGVRSTRPVGLRVLGTIAAGEPLDQFDAGETELLDFGEIAPALTAAPVAGASEREMYALRVRGTSMIGDGILDGDYVLIAPSPTALNGTIAVVVHKTANGGRGAATLKHVFRRDEGVLLQPANPTLDPWFVPAEEWDREWLVQGTVVAVHRQYGPYAPLPRTAAPAPRHLERDLSPA
jgi:repressor LexA